MPGLEHGLSWRPSGNLIVGTQRFGNIPGQVGAAQVSDGGSGLGPGRDGRHDIVFFERNGLRHGEFTLREWSPEGQHASERLKWGYRVREVGWSSDSNVLSVWIEREDGDVGMCFPWPPSAGLELIQTIRSPTLDDWKLPLVRSVVRDLRLRANLCHGVGT